MKAAEAAHQTHVAPDAFLVIRVDGRAFHSYTRGLRRPFDTDLMADLDVSTVALLDEVSAPLVAFTQSDEISVVCAPKATPGFVHWFGGRSDKVASVSASIVTAAFNQRRPGRLAHFDGRAFALETRDELVDYLRWRSADARRNAVSMLASAVFSPSQLHRRSLPERVAMLADAGVDIDTVDAGFRFGRLFVPQYVDNTSTFVDSRTGQQRSVTVPRRVWSAQPAAGDPAEWLASSEVA